MKGEMKEGSTKAKEGGGKGKTVRDGERESWREGGREGGRDKKIGSKEVSPLALNHSFICICLQTSFHSYAD